MVFNTTANKLQFYDGDSWESVGTGTGSAIAIDDLTDAETDYATDHNMFLGQGSGAAIVAGGQYNVALGENALNALEDGDNNIAIGYRALASSPSGGGNIAIGYQAGDDIMAGNNIMIGNDVDSPNAFESNRLNIGNTIYGDLSTSAAVISNSGFGAGGAFPDAQFTITMQGDWANEVLQMNRASDTAANGNLITSFRDAWR